MGTDEILRSDSIEDRQQYRNDHNQKQQNHELEILKAGLNGHKSSELTKHHSTAQTKINLVSDGNRKR